MAKRPAAPSRRSSRHSDADDDDDTPRLYQSHWWRAQDDLDCQSSLWNWITRQENYRSVHAFRDLLHEAIYYDRPLTGYASGAHPFQDFRALRSAPAHLNIVMSMVDTATAKLVKRRPMPTISADDAEWSEKQFAKATSRILRRKMGSSRVERMSPQVIRDFCIRGDGVMKIVRLGGDVAVERIPIYELVWDELEAMFGAVRTVAHVRPVAREVLLHEYPERRDEIMSAPAFRPTTQWSLYAYAYIIDSLADMVEVAEGTHLPAYVGDPNGQRVLSIRGAVLDRRPWKRPRFNIVRSHWSAPTRGFRGTGLVEQLAGTQAKINDIARDMQENLYYGSSLKIFQQRGSGVNKHHMRARHPVVVEYDGVEPHYSAPNVIPPSSMQFLQWLLQQAYDIAGISQMSASAKNTLGSNVSGRAIDTMEDIQSERFAHVESGWMQSRGVDVGMCMIDEARELYEEAQGRLGVENPIAMDDLAPWIAEHEWDKVEIDSGNYHLTLEPTNFIPETRGGKLSFVAELSKAGLIPDPTLTADLFDEPDIARMNRGVLGPKHRIDDILEGCTDLDVPLVEIMPDNYDNLPLLVLLAKGELKDAQAQRKRVPEEVLARYTQVIDEAKALMDNAKKGAAELAAPSPSLPGALPGDIGMAPNAATLQPGLGAPPMPAPLPGAGPGMPAGGLAA